MKAVKDIALLLAFACAVPAYAQETQLRTATEAEITSCGTKLAIAEYLGFVTSILPALYTGLVTGSAIHNFLVPTAITYPALKTILAGGAIGASSCIGLCAILTTFCVFMLPLTYLEKKYEKTYNKESYEKITCASTLKSDRWFMNSILGIPLALGAGILTFALYVRATGANTASV